MKTQFSIISYFDPYGDVKSTRKVFDRKNYESEKPLNEVRAIIEKYNDGKYYNGVEVAAFDNRRKEVKDFDKSHYLTGKARESTYQDI